MGGRPWYQGRKRWQWLLGNSINSINSICKCVYVWYVNNGEIETAFFFWIKVVVPVWSRTWTLENFGWLATVEDDNGIWAKIAIASYDTIRTEYFVLAFWNLGFVISGWVQKSSWNVRWLKEIVGGWTAFLSEKQYVLY